MVGDRRPVGVFSNRLTVNILRIICGKRSQGLFSLTLSSLKIGQDLLIEISTYNWENLIILGLNRNPISNRAVKIILKMNLVKLRIISLSGTPITTDCLKLLSKLPSHSLS